MSCAPRVLLCALLAVTAGLLALDSGSEKANASAQPVGLWLPWEAGTSWRLTNGPHGSSTDGLGAALDFQPPDAGASGCNSGFSSSYWVVAAAGGKVIDRSNGMEIDHGSGFRTGYLHLQEKQVTSGRVDAGDRLGKVSCCPDGGFDFCWATAPHLHFYTVYNGARQGIVGINLEGWVVREDGCLVRGEERACVMGSLESGAPAPSPSNVDVVVILDATADSATGDPQRARLAAARAYLGASGPDDRVAVVTYNSEVHDRTRLYEVKGKHGMNRALLQRIDSVGADGEADLRVGVRSGCRELKAAQAETRAAVLITDGVHDRAELGQPQKCFMQRQWPVYTVAVGPGGEETLVQIASDTGGQFLNLGAVSDLGCEMHKLRMAISSQQPGACKTDRVLPEKTTRIEFEVADGQAEATFSATWLRTDVPSAVSERTRIEVELVSPSGRAIKPDPTVRGDIVHELGSTYASYTVLSPEPGPWAVRLTGAEVPPEGAAVTVAVTAMAAHPAPGSTLTAAETAGTGEDGLPGTADDLPSDTPAPTPSADATPGTSGTATPKPTAKPAPKKTFPPTNTPTPTPEPTPPPTPEPTPDPTPEPTPEPPPDATPEPPAPP